MSRNDKGFDGLEPREVIIPQVGETEVLVKLNAAALNYRDLIIAKVFKTEFLLSLGKQLTASP